MWQAVIYPVKRQELSYFPMIYKDSKVKPLVTNTMTSILWLLPQNISDAYTCNLFLVNFKYIKYAFVKELKDLAPHSYYYYIQFVKHKVKIIREPWFLVFCCCYS